MRKAAGSYVCGEETALLESLEGKRGIVRAKPPLPAISGLFGKPTVINNVISLASVPVILAKGASFYKDYGMGRSSGTLPFQLAGNIKHGGLIEKAFGVTLRELMYDFGGGSASGRPIKAVQVGGPLGAYLPESQWDTPLDYEAYTALWAVLGHGGIVVSRRPRGHGQTGALCDEILRDRVLRQMHAVPDRRNARRGGDRQDHCKSGCRPGPAGADRVVARPVRHDAERFDVRDGRHDTLSGVVRIESLSKRLWSR